MDKFRWANSESLLHRQQVPGAIAGLQLGEAAHRLVKNSLNIRSNGSSHILMEQPSYHGPMFNYASSSRQRPVGQSNYNKGYYEDPSCYYGHNGYAQSSYGYPRYPNNTQGHRNISRMPDKPQHQERYRDLRTGISSLTIEGSVRSRAPAEMSSRVSNFGYSQNLEQPSVQSIGSLPTPPTKWINQPSYGDDGLNFQKESTSNGAAYDKQVRPVFKIKTRPAQDSLDSMNHWSGKAPRVEASIDHAMYFRSSEA